MRLAWVDAVCIIIEQVVFHAPIMWPTYYYGLIEFPSPVLSSIRTAMRTTTIILLLFGALTSAWVVTPEEKAIEIRMPGARPTRSDDYLCSAFSIKNMTRGTGNKKVYITAFHAQVNTSEVGHLALIRFERVMV